MLFCPVQKPGVVCSEKVTFDPLIRWPVDLFKKEPLKGNSEVHLHTPTKFGEDPSKDLGGVGEQTNKQTNAAQIIVLLANSGGPEIMDANPRRSNLKVLKSIKG